MIKKMIKAFAILEMALCTILPASAMEFGPICMYDEGWYMYGHSVGMTEAWSKLLIPVENVGKNDVVEPIIIYGSATPDKIASVKVVADSDMKRDVEAAEGGNLWEFNYSFWPYDMPDSARKWIVVSMKDSKEWSGAYSFRVGLKGTDLYSEELNIVGFEDGPIKPMDAFGLNITGFQWWGEGYWFESRNDSITLSITVPSAGVLKIDAPLYYRGEEGVKTLKVGGSVVSDVKYGEDLYPFDDFTCSLKDLTITTIGKGVVTLKVTDDWYFECSNIAFYHDGKQSVNISAWSEGGLIEEGGYGLAGYTRGYVTGGGTFAKGSRVTLTAVPGNGEVFDRWVQLDDDGNEISTVALSEAQLTSPTLSFVVTDSMVGSVKDYRQVNFCATWKEKYDVMGITSPIGAGTISGGGSYVPGTDFVLSVKDLNSLSTFKYWEDNSSITSPIRSIVSKGQDVIYTAVYGSLPRLTINCEDGGSVVGGGIFPAGKTVTLKATANKGYVFAGWFTADGEPVSGASDYRSPSYSYVTTGEDITLVAKFIPIEEPVIRVSGGGDALQRAIEKAALGAEILVGPGTYSPIRTKGKNIIIRSMEGAEKTLIDGGRQQRCATLVDDSVESEDALEMEGTTLVGFTLIGGYERGVEGVTEQTSDGGGVFGGVLVNCIIKDCESYLVYADEDDGCGGGACGAKLYNCLITGCTASTGAGASDCLLYNCTIVDNDGVCPIGYSKAYNCIISGCDDLDTWNSAYYNCLAPTGDYYPVPELKHGNVLFVDINKGDYRLSAASEGINAAAENYVQELNKKYGDLDSCRRNNSTVDIGAYEYGALSLVFDDTPKCDVADISFTMYDEYKLGMAIEPVLIDVSGCTSLPTVKVTGLPAGLKFTAKPIYKKGSKTEVEVPANTIYGTPTKSGVYTVVATVTTAGKKTATCSQTIMVVGLPDAIVGTFNGFVKAKDGEENIGTFQFVATDLGKLTAKVITSSGTYTFSATGWSSVEGSVYAVGMETPTGDLLRLSINSLSRWDENQLTGTFKANGKSEHAVHAKRNAFGNSWYFSADGDAERGWTLSYVPNAILADIIVTLNADGSTKIAGALSDLKVSAAGYADVTSLVNGVIFADFAPVISVKNGKISSKRVLSLRTNLWFDRSNSHIEGVGSARFTE